jgi:hypothetical protein
VTERSAPTLDREFLKDASERTMRAKDRFRTIVAELSASDGVAISNKRGFSHGGLLVHGKIFAILRRDALLLKLPETRVSNLIANGDGGVFDAGKGRPMKEWVIIPFHSSADWLRLAGEARSFVAG